MSSKVFTVTFDYDDWPSNHYNDERCIKSYNGSVFGLRNHYKSIYFESQFVPMDQLSAKDFDSTKIRKISYSINLLM